MCIVNNYNIPYCFAIVELAVLELQRCLCSPDCRCLDKETVEAQQKQSILKKLSIISVLNQRQ